MLCVLTVLDANPYWFLGITVVFNALQDAFTIRLPAAWHALAKLCYTGRRLNRRTCLVRAPLSEDLGRSCVLVRCRPVLSVHLTAEAGRKSEAFPDEHLRKVSHVSRIIAY